MDEVKIEEVVKGIEQKLHDNLEKGRQGVSLDIGHLIK